jgi:hypothetical protein
MEASTVLGGIEHLIDWTMFPAAALLDQNASAAPWRQRFAKKQDDNIALYESDNRLTASNLRYSTGPHRP